MFLDEDVPIIYHWIDDPEKLDKYHIFTNSPWNETLDSNGHRHSYDDQPAVIRVNGTKMWYKYGKRHRDNDLPAIVYSNGTQAWYRYGQLHRDNDRPAVVHSNGHKEWWVNGKIAHIPRIRGE